jgi:hypothetical protein
MCQTLFGLPEHWAQQHLTVLTLKATANSMKSHENHDGLGATDSAPQPGDFFLGSVESRAAARGKLMRMQDLNPYDTDCLVIQCMVPLICS